MSAMSGGAPTAVVTGASSGIGRIYALRLAELGYRLLLVARDTERLEAVKREVEKLGSHALVMAADLDQPEAIEAVASRISELPQLEFLVNNAGFGTMGDFVDVEVSAHVAMINVHVLATIRLTHAALAGMLTRGRGKIVNVSSMSAFLIGPGQTTYAATKALLVSFCESLQGELEGTGVRVQALCPGFTKTDFHNRPPFARFDRNKVSPGLWKTPEEVVEASLAGLEGPRVVCIPGGKNRLVAGACGMRFVRKLVGKKVRKK